MPSNVKEWKQDKIRGIMQMLDHHYTPFSEVYKTVEGSLEKLSMQQLSSLYVMVLTSTKPTRGQNVS